MVIPIIKMSHNRVRRNYIGGAVIDSIRGIENAQDNDRPEEWLCSVVEAKNPGLAPVEHEGLSLFVHDGKTFSLKDALEQHPLFYLGKKQYTPLTFLAKWLDSRIRLHTQAHPTREFSKAFLGSDYGKFEAYYVLSVRDSVKNPYIRLGFQREDISKSLWRKIVATQDMDLMDSCFEQIPIAVGDIIYIPGGMPHAIGEGVLLLEIMEPSDLVVRCEFEREGMVVPEGARFMGRTLGFCMDVFDYTYFSKEDIRRKFFIKPQPITASSTFTRERLLGSDISGCFDLQRITVTGKTEIELDDRYAVVLCTKGNGIIENGVSYTVDSLDSFFVAANTKKFTVTPTASEIELCIIFSPEGK